MDSPCGDRHSCAWAHAELLYIPKPRQLWAGGYLHTTISPVVSPDVYVPSPTVSRLIKTVAMVFDRRCNRGPILAMRRGRGGPPSSASGLQMAAGPLALGSRSSCERLPRTWHQGTIHGVRPQGLAVSKIRSGEDHLQRHIPDAVRQDQHKNCATVRVTVAVRTHPRLRSERKHVQPHHAVWAKESDRNSAFAYGLRRSPRIATFAAGTAIINGFMSPSKRRTRESLSAVRSRRLSVRCAMVSPLAMPRLASIPTDAAAWAKVRIDKVRFLPPFRPRARQARVVLAGSEPRKCCM